MSTLIKLFTPLNVETAPEKSRPLLEKIQKLFKFIPNLFGVFATALLHVPSGVVSAVRSNLPPTDSKLNSLVVLTKEIVSLRGQVGAQTIKNFLAAGYRKDLFGSHLPDRIGSGVTSRGLRKCLPA